MFTIVFSFLSHNVFHVLFFCIVQQDVMAEIVLQFQATVLSVTNLVPDRYFDAFTRPVINNKIEEKTCGEGPSLSAMFKDDKHLQSIISQIKVQNVLF